MKFFLLAAALAIPALAQYRVVTWTKYTPPGGCSDSAGTPCYWPLAQGYNSIVPDPVNGGVLVYSTRQASTGTVTVSGGTTVTWVSGDQFDTVTWGLGTTDQIVINGVTRTITQGSVSATTLTITASTSNAVGVAYSATPGAITMSTAVYVWNSSTHTFGAPWPNSHATLTNTSGNLETDLGGSFPADRQQSAMEFYDSSRSSVWLTGGINGGKAWDTTSHQTTVWRVNLSSKVWTGLVPAHYIANNAAQASAIDVDDQVVVQVGTDGGAGFRTNVYCPTDLNPTPGTRTANQTSAGCSAADDWVQVTTTGTTMPNLAFPAMAYVGGTVKAFFLFTEASGTIYKYAPLTKVWSTVGSTCSLPTLGSAIGSGTLQPAWAVLSGGTIFYHFFPATGGTQSDWIYDPVADACYPVATNGGPIQIGGVWGVSIAQDPATGNMVGWEQGSQSIWVGVLAPGYSAGVGGSLTLGGKASVH